MSLQREEYLRKKRRKRLFKIGLFLFVLIILLCLVIYISRLPSVRISKIELSGGILVTQSDVEKETVDFLRGFYLWVFPKNNSLFFPDEKLGEFLKEKFKRIDSIKINRKDLQTISVTIKERRPHSLWCDGFGDIADLPGRCYFMDDNGTVFVEAPYFSGNAYFKYYGFISSGSPIIGAEYMASSTKFHNISDFISGVEKNSTTPIYLVAEESGEFTLVLSSGAKIYFDTKEPLQKILSNLEALLRSKVFSTTSDPTAGVDYIDLRFGNKLYYKFRQ